MQLLKRIQKRLSQRKEAVAKKRRRQLRSLRIETLETRQLCAVDFRTYDGTGNNLLHPQWGSTEQAFLRISPAAYADGKSVASGGNRLGARQISNLVAAHPANDVLDERGLSSLIYAWGQFLDHDLDLTPSSSPAESMAIPVPQGDASFDPQRTGTKTLSFTRSLYDPATGVTNAREQINRITAFIDGSMVYGSDAATADGLRTFSGGRLKASEGNLLPMASGFFVAGDIRADENPELIAMHTLFMREHNRIAGRLSIEHTDWNDERVYQESRRVVIGEIQAITYNEFLPALLGPNALRPYRGYNPNVNPGIANEFAAAAYRLGHSMLGPDIEFLDNQGVATRAPVALRDAFFNPAIVQENGIEEILKYLASNVAERLDTRVVDDVRNFLFGPPGSGGLDLAALNIQRGRDHGLANYNAVRQTYGLVPVRTFAEISSNPETQNALRQAYGTVNDIDLWVGGLAEDHVAGAAVGVLFQRMLTDQFSRLRDGDRFWYERDMPTATVDMVRRTRLADIIRQNTTTTNLQYNVFVFRPAITGRVFQDANRNGRLDNREVGVANLNVQLVDGAGNIVATTRTARDGSYRFQDVSLKTYRVVIRPADPKASATILGTRDVTVSRGDTLAGIDLGLPPLAPDPRAKLGTRVV